MGRKRAQEQEEREQEEREEEEREDALLRFVESWRELFVSTLQPTHLPPGWRTDHRRHRSSVVIGGENVYYNAEALWTGQGASSSGGALTATRPFVHRQAARPGAIGHGYSGVRPRVRSWESHVRSRCL